MGILYRIVSENKRITTVLMWGFLVLLVGISFTIIISYAWETARLGSDIIIFAITLYTWYLYSRMVKKDKKFFEEMKYDKKKMETYKEMIGGEFNERVAKD